MTEPWLRRVARRTLILGVRGRNARGSEWGEALIGEFEETTGSWDAVRWALSGLRATRRARHVPQWVRVRRRAVVAVVALAVIGVPVNAYAAGVALNPSGAMAPALQPGDRILVDKLSFRWTGLDHGDIVVITVEDDTWIKRVIGLPGDVVECRDGAVFRNGSKIDEDYLLADTVTECSAVTVLPGEIYVLGDHREASCDSRQLGTFAVSAVTGRALTRMWPIWPTD
ncbi:signal peptidase I [Catellatospora citrea]|uniref:signal peptidase I n=1 Tax=Catellatospora citrea TaxID=53366 RepID=UPI00340515A2